MTRDRRLGSAWGKGWQRGQRSPSKSSLLGRCGRLYNLSHMLHFVHTQLFPYPSLGVWHPKIRKPTMFISFGLFDVPNLWNKCWSIWQIYLRSTSTKHITRHALEELSLLHHCQSFRQLRAEEREEADRWRLGAVVDRHLWRWPWTWCLWLPIPFSVFPQHFPYYPGSNMTPRTPLV